MILSCKTKSDIICFKHIIQFYYSWSKIYKKLNLFLFKNNSGIYFTNNILILSDSKDSNNTNLPFRSCFTNNLMIWYSKLKFCCSFIHSLKSFPHWSHVYWCIGYPFFYFEFKHCKKKNMLMFIANYFWELNIKKMLVVLKLNW